MRAALDELGARGREASSRSRCRTPSTRSRPTTSSAPRRRRRTWRATTASLRLSRRRTRARSRSCTRGRAARASAPSPSGASCSAPTCCAPATTTRTTARRCARGARSPTISRRRSRSCDAIVTPTSPMPAFQFGERMGDPLQMYLADVLHRRRQPGRPPGAVAALRLHQGGPADRPADHRPAARRGDLLPRRRPPTRRAPTWHERLPPDGAERDVSGCDRHAGRSTRSSSASRCTCSSRRSRRSSPGRRRRSAPSRTRTPIRSAWACRARCRC